jgi:threonine/homoserine/homoserine lactone efflux protein
MSTEEFSALLLFATAMSFTPGPNTTLSAALAANFGLRRALGFIVAVPTGWTLMMLACGLGLGALVLAMPALRWAIKALGIGYLLWMAWKLAGSATLGEADRSRLDVGFWQGVALQFVNIKAWMLALALAAGWVTSAAGQPAANPGQRLAIVCGVMLVFALTSNLGYALVGSMLRGWLAQGRRLLWFNRTMALLLVATAAWMVTA